MLKTLKQPSAKRDHQNERSTILNSSREHCQHQDGKVFWLYARKVAGRSTRETVDKFNNCVISVAEQKVINLIQTCHDSYYKRFIKGMVWSVLDDHRVFTMSKPSHNQVLFEDAAIQVAAFSKAELRLPPKLLKLPL